MEKRIILSSSSDSQILPPPSQFSLMRKERERENNEDPVCRAIKPNFDIANMQN